MHSSCERATEIARVEKNRPRHSNAYRNTNSSDFFFKINVELQLWKWILNRKYLRFMIGVSAIVWKINCWRKHKWCAWFFFYTSDRTSVSRHLNTKWTELLKTRTVVGNFERHAEREKYRHFYHLILSIAKFGILLCNEHKRKKNTWLLIYINTLHLKHGIVLSRANQPASQPARERESDIDKILCQPTKHYCTVIWMRSDHFCYYYTRKSWVGCDGAHAFSMLSINIFNFPFGYCFGIVVSSFCTLVSHRQHFHSEKSTR